jgi:CheY-like chemotaxis protein
MSEAADAVRAVTSLIWPLIVVVLVWRLYPSIRGILQSRGFTIKYGKVELTVQQASDQLIDKVEELGEKLSEARKKLGLDVKPVGIPSVPQNGGEPGKEVAAQPRRLRRVLWVDDNPTNNAYELAQMDRLEIDVVQARTTNEALERFRRSKPQPDAIISDMGRKENGSFNPKAGLDLIRRIRAQDPQVPIFIYASPRSLELEPDVLREKGNGITASSVELFELLRGLGSFRLGRPDWLSPRLRHLQCHATCDDVG